MAGKIELQGMKPGYKALGIALDLLSHDETYARIQTRFLVGTIRGAVERGHFVFLKEGNDYVGFTCWGECTAELGESWANGGQQPSFEACSSGDCILLFITHVRNQSYINDGLEQLKSLFRGRTVYRRHHEEGKIIPQKFIVDGGGTA